MSKRKIIFDEILDRYPDDNFLRLDGYDEAVIGLNADEMRLIYSKARILEILQTEKMDYQTAQEFYDYNIEGSLAGGEIDGYRFPIICEDDYFVTKRVNIQKDEIEMGYIDSERNIGIMFKVKGTDLYWRNYKNEPILYLDAQLTSDPVETDLVIDRMIIDGEKYTIRATIIRKGSTVTISKGEILTISNH